MSLSQKTEAYDTPIEHVDHKHPEYAFVLVLVCMALALVVGSAIFTPAPVGSGIASEITTVGP
jgi:hypothetical protein